MSFKSPADTAKAVAAAATAKGEMPIIKLAILGFLGISVAKQTGCYTPPTEAREWSEQEIQSFRQVLIQATDRNVQYTTVAPETKAASKKANNSKKVEVTKKASAKTTKKVDK